MATQSKSMSTTFAQIDKMLSGLRSKEAAEIPVNPPTSTEISDKEGVKEAEKAGGNVDSVAPNSEGNLATDKVTGGVPAQTADTAPSQIAAQPIPAEQKTARFNKLAQVAIQVLEQAASYEIQKEAAEQIDPALAAMQKRADEILAGQRDIIVKAMQLRARDTMLVKEACAANADFHKVVEEFGGVDAYLDKIAEAAPEVMLSEIDPSLVPPEAGAVPEMGAVEGEAAPAGDDANLDELAAALEAQGVTKEDLQAAAEAIGAMKAEGASDEQVVQAVQELMQEGMAAAEGGEAAPAAEEAPAPEVEAEAPASEEAEKEASLQKQAAERARIDVLKSFARKAINVAPAKK